MKTWRQELHDLTGVSPVGPTDQQKHWWKHMEPWQIALSVQYTSIYYIIYYMIIYIHIQSCIHGKARATRIFDKSPNLLISPAIKPTGKHSPKLRGYLNRCYIYPYSPSFNDDHLIFKVVHLVFKVFPTLKQIHYNLSSHLAEHPTHGSGPEVPVHARNVTATEAAQSPGEGWRCVWGDLPPCWWSTPRSLLRVPWKRWNKLANLRKIHHVYLVGLRVEKGWKRGRGGAYCQLPITSLSGPTSHWVSFANVTPACRARARRKRAKCWRLIWGSFMS